MFGIQFAPGRVGDKGEPPAPLIDNILVYTMDDKPPAFFRMDTTPWQQFYPMPDVVTKYKSVDFNRERNVIAFAGIGGGAGPTFQNSLEVWATDNWPFVFEFSEFYAESGNCVRFSKNGAWLFVGTTSTSTPNYVYDALSWLRPGSPWTTINGQAEDATWNHDGTMLVSAMGNSSPVMQSYFTTTDAGTPIVPGTLRSLPTNPPTDPMFSCDFHPSVNVMVIGGSGISTTQLLVFDMDTNARIGDLAASFNGSPRRIRWNKAGDRLAVSGSRFGSNTPAVIVYIVNDPYNPASWTLESINDNVDTVNEQRSVNFDSEDDYMAGGLIRTYPNRFAWDVISSPYNRIDNFDFAQLTNPTANNDPTDCVFFPSEYLPAPPTPQTYNVTISANGTDVNLYDEFTALHPGGANPGDTVNFTIDAGVTIGCSVRSTAITSNAPPSLSTGEWIGGVNLTLVNNSNSIYGAGGNSLSGGRGAQGGTAFKVLHPIVVTNNGAFIGGGGGGGSTGQHFGTGASSSFLYQSSGGGGAGSPGGEPWVIPPEPGLNMDIGDFGTLTTGGVGGSWTAGQEPPPGGIADAGNGGNSGQSGTDAGDVALPGEGNNVGGDAGYSVEGTIMITWVNQGSLVGPTDDF